MSNESAAAEYTETIRRMLPVTTAGALGITMLLFAATWDNPKQLAVVAGVQLALLPINVWLTLGLRRSRGVRVAESVRALINLSGTAAIGHFTGWPLPIWLWLPFVAISVEHLGLEISWLVLAGLALVMNLSALSQGVPWLYPVSFTALAVFCSIASRTRVTEISRRLVGADAQRREIEAAHAEAKAANDRLSLVMQEREHADLEQRQSHKLEAVGRLASGIAHEINTPVQFVTDSIKFLESASEDLLALTDRATSAKLALRAGTPADQVAAQLERAEEELDVIYLAENLPAAFARSLDGLSRVATIVQSMKQFAHPGTATAPVDLKRAILSTLTIARSEYKRVAEVETHFAELPLVTCNVGDLNQVVLNLVVNAAHAITDVVGDSGQLGKIEVRVELEGESVVISVGDTGAGIPDAIRDRIFEPFFTTKEVGKGTGQGLALARSVVTKHQGTLTFRSVAGVGTTFFIRLPIDPPKPAQAAA
jgi:signal transduction histidine kinase